MTEVTLMPGDLDLTVIGERLRHSRKLKRLLLRDLADRIGCSESALSKIERGRAKPSLDMLHRITAALDTSIGALFNGADEKDLVIYASGRRQTIKIADETCEEAIRLERLIPLTAERALQGNIHIVAPGASNGGEIKHLGEEVGYVIAGELELTVASEVYLLRPGDSFFFRSDLPHSYRNRGDAEARVIWINTPPTF